MTHRHICCSGAVRAIISHRVKQISDIMKDLIKPQEYRLLAAIILSGLCANSHYTYSPEFHIVETVSVLNKLLSVINDSDEVK